MIEPIVMAVEEEVTTEEVVLIARHLAEQGFGVQVESLDPLRIVLTYQESPAS